MLVKIKNILGSLFHYQKKENIQGDKISRKFTNEQTQNNEQSNSQTVSFKDSKLEIIERAIKCQDELDEIKKEIRNCKKCQEIKNKELAELYKEKEKNDEKLKIIFDKNIRSCPSDDNVARNKEILDNIKQNQVSFRPDILCNEHKKYDDKIQSLESKIEICKRNG